MEYASTIRSIESCLPDFKISKLSCEDDLKQLDSVWKSVYGQEFGWIDESSEITLYEDCFHDHSSYLGASINGTYVGVMRIVSRSKKGLPVEKFTSLKDVIEPDNHNVIECQRLSVTRDCRSYRSVSAPFGVWPALMKVSLQYMLKYGYDTLIADCFTDTKTTPTKSLKKIGFRETGIIFRDTELEEASDSTVLVLGQQELLQNLYGCYSKFNNYILTQQNYLQF